MNALQGLLVVVCRGERYYYARNLINTAIKYHDQPIFNHLRWEMIIRVNDHLALCIKRVLAIVTLKDLPDFGREIDCHPFLLV